MRWKWVTQPTDNNNSKQTWTYQRWNSNTVKIEFNNLKKQNRKSSSKREKVIQNVESSVNQRAKCDDWNERNVFRAQNVNKKGNKPSWHVPKLIGKFTTINGCGTSFYRAFCPCGSEKSRCDTNRKQLLTRFGLLTDCCDENACTRKSLATKAYIIRSESKEEEKREKDQYYTCRISTTSFVQLSSTVAMKKKVPTKPNDIVSGVQTRTALSRTLNHQWRDAESERCEKAHVRLRSSFQIATANDFLWFESNLSLTYDDIFRLLDDSILASTLSFNLMQTHFFKLFRIICMILTQSADAVMSTFFFFFPSAVWFSTLLLDSRRRFLCASLSTRSHFVLPCFRIWAQLAALLLCLTTTEDRMRTKKKSQRKK